MDFGNVALGGGYLVGLLPASLPSTTQPCYYGARSTYCNSERKTCGYLMESEVVIAIVNEGAVVVIDTDTDAHLTSHANGRSFPPAPGL
jgi:hypothetical protein